MHKIIHQGPEWVSIYHDAPTDDPLDGVATEKVILRTGEFSSVALDVADALAFGRALVEHCLAHNTETYLAQATARRAADAWKARVESAK